MANERSTLPEWLTTEDAVSLLDAPYREAPSLIDTARAPFALGLLLVPLFMVLAVSAAWSIRRCNGCSSPRGGPEQLAAAAKWIRHRTVFRGSSRHQIATI